MIFLYALKQIRNHWIRTTLAVLGVLIGTCAFIVLTNIGLIYQFNLEQELNEIGKNTNVINLLYPPNNAKHLTESDIKKLVQKPIKAVIPIAFKSYNYTMPNGNSVNLNIIGIPFNMQKPFDIKALEGRLIIPSDETNVTFSQPLADEMSQNKNTIEIGDDFLLDHQVLHIVGKHSKQKEGLRTLLFGEVNHQIVMNLNSALNVIPDLYIERLIVILENNIHTQEDLEILKNNIERISPGIQVFIQNFSSMYEATQTISMQFNLFLSLVGFISLLIGGVGIMNIMLVIVTERQSEIGLRMAIGAKRSQIIYLFLIESVVICLLGGLTGIVLAIPILYGITLMMRVSFMFFSKTVIIGFTIPIIIGLFFGMFPAIKAARMDPIKALNS